MCRMSSILDCEAHSLSPPVNLPRYRDKVADDLRLEMKEILSAMTPEFEDFWCLQLDLPINCLTGQLCSFLSCSGRMSITGDCVHAMQRTPKLIVL